MRHQIPTYFSDILIGAPDPIVVLYGRGVFKKPRFAKVFAKITAAGLVCVLVGGPLFSYEVRAASDEQALETVAETPTIVEPNVEATQEVVEPPQPDEQGSGEALSEPALSDDATAAESFAPTPFRNEQIVDEKPMFVAVPSDETSALSFSASSTDSQETEGVFTTATTTLFQQEAVLVQTDITDGLVSETSVYTQQQAGDASEEVVSPEQEAREHDERERYLRQEMRNEIVRQLKQECLEFDSGGYYCVSSLMRQQYVAEPRASASGFAPTVFSVRDEREGDAEIYLRTDQDELLQITDNTTEDLFPARDRFSGRVVWQSFVDNAWRIFLYDPQTATSTQISVAASNSMNPSIDDGRVVWQGWVNGTWEIFLAHEERVEDGTAKFAVEQITNNTTHDMFPKIEGGMAVWQAYRDGAWHIDAYAFADKKITQLTQGPGKHERPRFALVWDAIDENGNVTTMQYDPETGMTSFVVGERTHELPFTPQFPENQAPAAQGSVPPPPIAAKEDQGDALDALTNYE